MTYIPGAIKKAKEYADAYQRKYQVTNEMRESIFVTHLVYLINSKTPCV